jgi:hypothetical protein
MITCSLYKIVVYTMTMSITKDIFLGMHIRHTFPAESNPSMSIRTSLSLLQLRRDERELKSEETERPIQA